MSNLGLGVRLGASRGVAEAVSIVAGLGVIPLLDKVTPQPMNALRHYVARQWVLPHIDFWDRQARGFPALVGDDKEISKLDAMPDDQRSEYYAKGLVNYSIMGTSGLVSQIATQAAGNWAVGIPNVGTGSRWFEKRKDNFKKLGMATALDKGINIGAIAVMQKVTPGMTVKVEDNVASFLEKTIGLKREKSKYLVNWQIPNAFGFIGSVSSLYNAYKREMPRMVPGYDSGPSK